jgi:hypothetical protein
MPPWPDWLDWLKWDCIGAGIIGKILGHWFKLCVSAPRMLLVIVFSRLPRILGYSSQHGATKAPNQRLWGRSPHFRKLAKLAASTFLTLVVWSTVTWKSLWNNAGPVGDRILAAVLLLVSASWVISLGWICFSKAGQRDVAVIGCHSANSRSRTARPL